MSTAAHGSDPIVVTLRADFAVTAFVDDTGEWVCVSLPSSPYPVLLAATQPAAEALIALLTARLRTLRDRRRIGHPTSGASSPARSGHRSPTPGDAVRDHHRSHHGTRTTTPETAIAWPTQEPVPRPRARHRADPDRATGTDTTGGKEATART